MSAILETELRRERWRRHLAAEALDCADRDDFSLGVLGSRVEEPTIRLLLLPSDPDVDAVDFDDQFWDWLQEHKYLQIGEGQVHLGDRIVPGAHAAGLAVESVERWKWRSYTAFHRNGAIEAGLGDRGGTVRSSNEDQTVRYLGLKPAVAFSWAISELARTIPGGVTDGPFLLAVALRDTEGALLGDFGQGWQEPWQMRFPEERLGNCRNRHLLWHIEVEQLPDDTPAAQALAFSVGDRIDNAWGSKSKRYLDREGSMEGQFDLRRL